MWVRNPAPISAGGVGFSLRNCPNYGLTGALVVSWAMQFSQTMQSGIGTEAGN